MKFWHRLTVVAVSALLFAAAGLAQTQSVSKAPSDKADAANPRPALQILGTNEYPEGLKGTKAKWMVPPKPNPFDWSTEDDGADPEWEYAWEVTHIKFNHQEGHENDGMNIRWTYRHPLEHKSDGKGDGEYIVKKERNEPVLYKAEEDGITVKVRIQVKDALGNAPGQASTANIRAEAKDAQAHPQGDGGFMNLEEREVEFNADGISVEEVIDADGNTSTSEYVTFQINAVPDLFGEYTVRYKFYLKDPMMTDPGDMGPAREVEFDELSRIDVYSTCDSPKKPWNHGDYAIVKSLTQPWVSALAFMCYPCGNADKSDVNTMAENAAKHLHWGHTGTSGHGLEYVHESGEPGFSNQNAHFSSHNLTQYMAKYKNGETVSKVNCTDQASALYALMQLASSGATEALYMRGKREEDRNWFGYMKTVKFVGGTDSNHPFHEKSGYVQSAVVGSDDLASEKDTNGLKKRSFFDYHAAVRMKASGNMVDACFGPVVPSDGKSLTDYLNTSRDTSTEGEQTIEGLGVFAVGDEKVIDLSIR